MNNDNKTIHDFEFQLICEYFTLFNRQGPGSTEMTCKALGFLDDLPKNPRIADIGCGTGTQTMVLAENTSGTITAIDLFPEFLEVLNKKTAILGLQNRIRTEVADMNKLPFQPEELDLIWAEGSIYGIGFKQGMEEWRSFIKTGGYIAVTEATWFTETRPAEIEDFWMNAYPEINRISVKIDQMSKAGYQPIAHFILPVSCWTNHFYIDMPTAKEKFMEKYPDNHAARDLILNQEAEKRLYDKYHDYYGYVFYIGRKI